MGRGKSTHQLIPDVRARRITYEKRKRGLMKKAREFSVLCDVDTCVVVFPEAAAGGDCPTAPEIWPPDSGHARRIIERFRSAGSRHALVDRKKKKKHDLGWGGELLRDVSDSQLRSLLSTLDDRVDLAKRKLAAMKEEKRIAMASTDLRNESPSIDEVPPQKTLHQVRAAGAPEWVAGAKPDAHCSYSVNGCHTVEIEDDPIFHKFLMESVSFMTEFY